MKIMGAFPSDYLKAADIPNGRRVTVTIESVSIEKIGNSEDQRPVVYFQGKQKGLCLNKTNANQIIEIAKSDETDDWTGVQIALYSTKVDFQGRRVDALRVDYPPAPAQAPGANGNQNRQTRPLATPTVQAPTADDAGFLGDADDDQIPF